MTSLAFPAPSRGAEPPGPPAAEAANSASAPSRPARIGRTVQIPANGAPIALEIGGGTLIRLARPASTVFVANPDVADVQIKSPELVYVSAKGPGQTVIYAVDSSDAVLLNAPVRVELDVSRLRQSLRQLLPAERIAVASVDGNFVLSGLVSDAGRAEKARTLATAIAGEVKGAQVINRMTVATPNQVNLRVRIAEVNRNVLKQIGINWHKPFGNVQFNTDNPVAGVNFFTGSFLPGAEKVFVTLDALAQEGFLTVLAEPNLTAVSGQTARFLAGGEFPIPIAQSTAAGAAPVITVEFKQFGVQLAFTPTIIDAGRLSLKVRPEVSQLSTQGAVQIEGFQIPSLVVRSAETTVELGSGESFALAGLLQHTSEQDLSKVPWLGDIPILGALFRSNKFQHNETELVIIITPYLVKPSLTALAAPTDGLSLPHDAQQVLFGDTYRQKLPAPPRGPLNAGGRGLIGPAGFRLD
jgi:pilus assembly protein CpaC